MKNPKKWYRLSSHLCLLLAATIYVVWPMRTLQEWLPTPIQPLQSLLLFGFLCLAAIFWALERTLVPPPKFPTSIPHDAPLPMRRSIALLLGLLFVFQAIFLLDSPLGIDENVHALQMARNDIINEITPYVFDHRYSTQNHVLSHLGSILSMKIFGTNRYALRLPSIFFSLCCMFVLIFIGRPILSRLEFALLSLHLLTNQLVVWYSHSMRGYISMLALCLFLYLALYRLTQNRPALPTQGILLAFVLTPFTHIFGGVFAVVLWIAFLFWMALSRSSLSEAQWHSGVRYLKGGLLFSPVLLIMFGFEAIRLIRIRDFQAASSPQVHDWLLSLFGLSYLWQIKLIACFGLFALCIGIVSKRWQPSLHFTFLLTTVVFLSMVFYGLKVRVFMPRFVLAFVPPVVLLFVKLCQQGSTNLWFQRIAPFFLVLGFVGFPLMSGPAVRHLKVQNFEPFDNLIKKTEVITSKFPDRCFDYVGKADVVSWAREFYFRKVPPVNDLCRHAFLLQIGDSDRSLDGLEVLHRESSNIALFRLPNNASSPKLQSRL